MTLNANANKDISALLRAVKYVKDAVKRKFNNEHKQLLSF